MRYTYMMNMFRVKKKDTTSAEDKLDKIRDILFPKYLTKLSEDGTKYHVDASIDTNIDAVLTDLEEGYTDEICHTTLRAILDSLHQVRTILGIENTIDKDAKYFVVSPSLHAKIDPESIQVTEDSSI